LLQEYRVCVECSHSDDEQTQTAAKAKLAEIDEVLAWGSQTTAAPFR
jgi:hypothetical protein